MDVLFSIIVIIVGILQICLFFKLWGLANNAIKIRDSINRDSIEKNLIKEAQLFCMKNDYNNAVEKYNDAFLSRIIKLYEKLVLLYGANNESPTRDKEYQDEFQRIVPQYQKCLKRIDKSLDFEKYDTFEKVNKVIARIF